MAKLNPRLIIMQGDGQRAEDYLDNLRQQERYQRDVWF